MLKFLKVFFATLPTTEVEDPLLVLQDSRSDRAAELATYGGTLRRAAARFLARGLRPDDQTVMVWGLEGVPAKDILWRWKLACPGAKSPGEAAHRLRFHTRNEAFRLVDEAFADMAIPAGLAQMDWDYNDEAHYIDADRDVWEAFFATSPDAGVREVRAALSRVKAARKAQAEAEGVEVLGEFLDITAPDAVLPAGWRWAHVGDARRLARWVHSSGACLVRVLTGEIGGAELHALALGPDGEVVGFTETHEGYRCPDRSFCCDVNNRHDDGAWAWAQRLLPHCPWAEPMAHTWEDLVEELLVC